MFAKSNSNRFANNRGRFRIRLRTMFGGFVLLAIVLAIVQWRLNSWNRQTGAVALLNEQGMYVQFGECYVLGIRVHKESIPAPIVRGLGRAAFADVVSVSADGYLANRIDESGYRALQAFPVLKSIDLMKSDLMESDVLQLSMLTTVNSLSIEDSRIPDGTFTHLKTLRSLHELRLSGRAISDSTLRDVSSLSSLESLHLSFCGEITRAGAQEVFKLPRLRHLVMQSCESIDDDALMGIDRAKSLYALELRQLPITDQVCGELAKCQNLTSLSLYACWVSDDGVQLLAKCKDLRQLDLSSTDISDEGLSVVARMSSLEVLDISKTDHTDIGVSKLRALKALRELTAGPGCLTDTIQALKNELPHCHIVLIADDGTVRCEL